MPATLRSTSSTLSDGATRPSPPSARRSRLRTRALFAAIAGAALALTAVASAGASEIRLHSLPCVQNPTDWFTCPSLANNSYHTWREDGILGNQIDYMDSAVAIATNDLDSAKNFRFFRDETDSQPDLWIGDYDYGLNDARAWDACQPPGANKPAYAQGGNRNLGFQGRLGTGWCFGQQIRFNAAYLYDTDTAWKLTHIACHEIGHSVGMNHRNGAGHPGSLSVYGDEDGTQTCMDNPNDDATQFSCWDLQAVEDFWGDGARSCGPEHMGMES